VNIKFLSADSISSWADTVRFAPELDPFSYLREEHATHIIAEALQYEPHVLESLLKAAQGPISTCHCHNHPGDKEGHTWTVENKATEGSEQYAAQKFAEDKSRASLPTADLVPLITTGHGVEAPDILLVEKVKGKLILRVVIENKISADINFRKSGCNQLHGYVEDVKQWEESVPSWADGLHVFPDESVSFLMLSAKEDWSKYNRVLNYGGGKIYPANDTFCNCGGECSTWAAALEWHYLSYGKFAETFGDLVKDRDPSPRGSVFIDTLYYAREKVKSLPKDGRRDTCVISARVLRDLYRNLDVEGPSVDDSVVSVAAHWYGQLGKVPKILGCKCGRHLHVYPSPHQSDKPWKSFSSVRAPGTLSFPNEKVRTAMLEALPGMLRTAEQTPEEVTTRPFECDKCKENVFPIARFIPFAAPGKLTDAVGPIHQLLQSTFENICQREQPEQH